ncbi:hypothetical protein Pcinc_022332 [Petrolisthes cinctipes]|uniref:Uncharacterized protein n=1 Tax=Petrolisthes cinctipes TaxID=88211 RepID=A0AAE1FDW1_PETCI|nr:hypothetical protein Pcinc_022332 [Petrolisthes cinctipes]
MIEHLEALDPLGSSDHIGIHFRFIFTSDASAISKTTFNYNKGNYAAMKEALNIDWEEALRGRTVQTMADYIDQAILQAVAKWVPTKTNFPKQARE